MRKCPIHNEAFEETNPGDAENGPHPSDVENRLVCPSCLDEVLRTIVLTTDDSPDFWEVFGGPFEPVDEEPGLDSNKPPVLTVHVVIADPHAGDQDVVVYPTVGGGMAYFDAGPEYRWMVAPAGTDIPQWIAAVEAAAEIVSEREKEDHDG